MKVYSVLLTEEKVKLVRYALATLAEIANDAAREARDTHPSAAAKEQADSDAANALWKEMGEVLRGHAPIDTANAKAVLSNFIFGYSGFETTLADSMAETLLQKMGLGRAPADPAPVRPDDAARAAAIAGLIYYSGAQGGRKAAQASAERIVRQFPKNPDLAQLAEYLYGHCGVGKAASTGLAARIRGVL